MRDPERLGCSQGYAFLKEIDLGFVVEPTAGAEQCTDVRSTRPFWFFNPQFHETISDIHANLRPAHEVATDQ